MTDLGAGDQPRALAPAITGGCRCGAVRYAIRVAVPPPVYACHCHQCQRWSGSAFSLQALVPEDAIEVEGPVAVYQKTTADRTSVQRVCVTCHSRIYNTNTRLPGIAVVRAGTLDDSECLQCKAHIFTASRQAWVVLPDDVPQWTGAAPAEDFAAALSA